MSWTAREYVFRLESAGWLCKRFGAEERYEMTNINIIRFQVGIYFPSVQENAWVDCYAEKRTNKIPIGRILIKQWMSVLLVA